MNSNNPIGIYKHYKGKKYEVLGVARHSETLEELIVYKALYESEFGKNALWVRPKSMFFETVIVENKEVKRFEKID
jgi:hypothetical protein